MITSRVISIYHHTIFIYHFLEREYSIPMAIKFDLFFKFSANKKKSINKKKV